MKNRHLKNPSSLSSKNLKSRENQEESEERPLFADAMARLREGELHQTPKPPPLPRLEEELEDQRIYFVIVIESQDEFEPDLYPSEPPLDSCPGRPSRHAQMLAFGIIAMGLVVMGATSHAIVSSYVRPGTSEDSDVVSESSPAVRHEANVVSRTKAAQQPEEADDPEDHVEEETLVLASETVSEPERVSRQLEKRTTKAKRRRRVRNPVTQPVKRLEPQGSTEESDSVAVRDESRQLSGQLDAVLTSVVVESSPIPSAPELPRSLTRSQVARGLRAVQGPVSACGRGGGARRVVVNAVIDGSTGRISSARVVSGAGTDRERCVVRAVERATFPRFNDRVLRVLSFPFVVN